MTKKVTRREFIVDYSPRILAAATLPGILAQLASCSSDSGDGARAPNVLLIMVDQMHAPPEGYAAGEGAAQGLKEILGFRPLSADNPYARFFPGMLRLRRNAVVMRRHYTASTACVASRCCIMTGQYPNVTGVDQTDALFKTYKDVPHLDPEGTPTLGDWFRAAGYSTHYFGKWHVSHAEAPDYLEPWGFADWDSSAPEAHGGSADNLGVYRDVDFTDYVVDFLKNRAPRLGPWFTVGSLVNPHDESVYPVGWEVPDGSGVVPWTDYPPPLTIPAKGQLSRLGGVNVKRVVELNPDGFPQECADLPRTWAESLADKPRCQGDYSLKFGLAFASSTDYNFERAGAPYRSPLPFQLRGESTADWERRYNQFYFYLQYLADLQIRRMLQALDESGLADSTIVIFLSDHGEMASAHGGMIQKFHSAYEEIVHVPMVISSPLVNPSVTQMREILEPTSSIDFAPTVLALAGLDEADLRAALERDRPGRPVPPLVGADLSPYVTGASAGAIVGPDGQARQGVFYLTNDMITELGKNDPGEDKKNQFEYFLRRVDEEIAAGMPLAPGTLRQPNNVRALCTGDWKIVEYVDPTRKESPEWELYCLASDPVEQFNLVDFATGQVRDGASVPGMTKAELVEKNRQLRTELARLESMYA